MSTDGTDTCTYHMGGSLPAGGDHLGGAFGQAPTLEHWYPQRLRVELLHRNGVDADPLGATSTTRRRSPRSTSRS